MNSHYTGSVVCKETKVLVAQWIEHLHVEQKVCGSTLIGCRYQLGRFLTASILFTPSLRRTGMACPHHSGKKKPTRTLPYVGYWECPLPLSILLKSLGFIQLKPSHGETVSIKKLVKYIPHNSVKREIYFLTLFTYYS